MPLSDKNARALLLFLNRKIEEYAASAVGNIFDKKNLEAASRSNDEFNIAGLQQFSSLSINEQLEKALENAANKKGLTLSYPPDGGLTTPEIQALLAVPENEYLKNALRKIIADNISGALFELLNILDGTAGPLDDATEIRLTNEAPHENQPEYQTMLHDGLFEAYWEWKKQRGEKPWKLDNLDD